MPPRANTNGPSATANRSTTPYVVDVLRSETDLAGLELAWNRLLETSETPNPFVSHAWFRAWLKRHAKETQAGHLMPWVLTLKQGNSIGGIVPLTRRISSRLLRVRRIAFVSHHSDYNDFIIGSDPEGQTRAVVEFLAQNKREWDIADLRDLRDAGEGTKLLEQALQDADLPYCILFEDEGSPFVRIDGGAAEALQRLSGHVRRTLRRRSERAADDHISVRIIERPDLEPGLIEALSILDRKKAAHRSSPLFFAAYRDVFCELFEDLGPKNHLYVALLEKDAQPIAFQLGFRCGKKLWDYTKAYDRAFSRFAPGTLLLPALLDYCAEHSFEEYDFLRGEEEYKLIWSSGIHRRYRVIVWNRRWESRLKAAIFLRFRVRRDKSP
jgi:CelD/BcsL family acetyltransferase involved in cellulose biosynthesis